MVNPPAHWDHFPPCSGFWGVLTPQAPSLRTGQPVPEGPGRTTQRKTQISLCAGETWGISRSSLQGRTSSLGELGSFSLLSHLVWGLGAPANTSHRPRVPTIHQLPLSRRQGRNLTDEIFIMPIYFLFVACVCIRVQAAASGAQAAAEIPTNVAHEYSTAAPATLCSH